IRIIHDIHEIVKYVTYNYSRRATRKLKKFVNFLQCLFTHVILVDNIVDDEDIFTRNMTAPIK
ncbi:hypothetical protein CR513_27384, partial [Mucuna pruriens]